MENQLFVELNKPGDDMIPRDMTAYEIIEDHTKQAVAQSGVSGNYRRTTATTAEWISQAI